MLFEGDLQTDQFAFTQAVALLDGGVSYDGPKSGLLQMQVDNVGGATANLRMNFFGNADAVGAIPEPETYALMLIGLGVLGMTSRRRNQH